MIERLSAFSSRRARTVVAFWVLAAVAMAIAAPSLASVGVQNETAFLPPTSPSLRAEGVLQRLFPGDPAFSSAVVVLSTKNAHGPAVQPFLRQLDGFLASPPMRREISVVESPVSSPALTSMLVSTDGRTELVVIGLRPAPFTAASQSVIDRLRTYLAHHAPPGLATHVTGITALGADETAAVTASFAKAGVAAGLLVVVILLFVYRSIVTLAVPLGTIAVGFAVAQGLVGLLAAHGFKVASLAATFMIVVAFGAGTDYCLFIMARYREELGSRSDRHAALAAAMRSVGPIVVASGATVVLAFGSLLVARFGIYRTMGPAIGVAVAVVLAASLTFTPAVLSMLPMRQFRTGDRAGRGHLASPLSFSWRSLGARVERHPVLSSTVPVVILLAGCAGLLGLHQSFDVVQELPPGAGARVGYEALARHFPPGQLAPIEIGIDAAGSILDPARLDAVDRLTAALRAVPGVERVLSVTEPLGEPITLASLSRLPGDDLTALASSLSAGERSRLVAALAAPGGLRLDGTWLRDVPGLRRALGFFLGADGRSTRLEVVPATDPYGAAGLETLHRVEVVAHRTLTSGPLAGSTLAIAGPSVAFGDIQQLATSDLGRIVLVVPLLVLAVLVILLRAVVAPVYLVVTVMMSFGASLGTTVVVFDRLLGQGSLSFWVPPFLFVILVALGADYTVFVMGRILEARRRGMEVPAAAVEGLVMSGPVTSAAGLILAGTFAVLLLTPLPTLRQVGFAVTLGVLVDTLVVRPLLVPALTVLAGRWAFWPGDAVSAGRVVRRARRRVLVVGLALSVAAAVAIAGLSQATSPSAPRRVLSTSPRPPVVDAGPLVPPAPVGPTPASVPPTTGARSSEQGPAATAAVDRRSGATPVTEPRPAPAPLPAPPPVSPPGPPPASCSGGTGAGAPGPREPLVCVVERLLGMLLGAGS